MVTDIEIQRREVVRGLGVAATGIVAGCQDGSEAPTETAEEDETPTCRPERTGLQLTRELRSDSHSLTLPPIWGENDSVEDLRRAVQVSATARNTTLDGLELVTQDGDAVADFPEADGETEFSATVELRPIDLVAGETTLRLRGTTKAGDRTETDPLTLEKDTPENYRIDFVPGENTDLREEIRADENIEDGYVERHGGLVTDDPVVTNYSTPEAVGFARKEIDLAALEYWHDNDYPQVSEYPEEVRRFFQSIDQEGQFREAKENPPYMYPNGSIENNNRGEFIYRDDENEEGLYYAESVDEALDWIQQYLFSWEFYEWGQGPISTEDEQYAAELQEALDKHTDIESHFWAFDLPEAARSTHGNGLVYDETNNKLHIMETIGGPETQTTEGLENGEGQYHPEVQESNYLNEDHDVYDHWWHPLRFAEEYRNDDKEIGGNRPLEFREAKGYVIRMFRGIATGGQDMREEWAETFSIGFTNEYTADIVDKLRNWNQRDDLGSETFQKIKNQSKIYNKLATEEDQGFMIYGTVDDPKYAKVDNSLVEESWNDETGELDDFDRILERTAA